MIKTTFALLAALALIAGASTLAEAKSIKSLMPASQLATYCATAGVGTATTTIAVHGKPLTGTVQCTAGDMKTAAASADSGESEVGPSEAAENGKED